MWATGSAANDNNGRGSNPTMMGDQGDWGLSLLLLPHPCPHETQWQVPCAPCWKLPLPPLKHHLANLCLHPPQRCQGCNSSLCFMAEIFYLLQLISCISSFEKNSLIKWFSAVIQTWVWTTKFKPEQKLNTRFRSGVWVEGRTEP